MSAEPRVSKAARELQKWVAESEYKTITRFAESNGLDRFKLYKAVNGELKRTVDVEFALAIERLTGQDIPAAWWADFDDDDDEDAPKSTRTAPHDPDRKAAG